MGSIPRIRSTQPPSQPRSGFSMVEIALVVLIIAMIAAVASPRYLESRNHFHAEAAAARVAADLYHARQNAKTKGTTQSVDFTPASHTYTLTGMNDIDHPTQPFTVDLTTLSSPATIVSVSFGSGGTGTTIVFDMYGRPDYGGNVVIASGGQQRTIVVNAQTGKISIQP
ncbi:hypothetical protein Mal4_18430 [Maioricimonas rarisocia]|uniref:Type II secretion system protein H n=1 Tax=Maioricimonas rarisocia TaxID=2528026 RepID=A0A517Z500_9PLAN|nr:GspH/FimT family protein [Maioricimonas rarisocia]QDU37529.1 hypothetical protein Mal4_18430 [Maioricimonas rarisocia]